MNTVVIKKKTVDYFREGKKPIKKRFIITCENKTHAIGHIIASFDGVEIDTLGIKNIALVPYGREERVSLFGVDILVDIRTRNQNSISEQEMWLTIKIPDKYSIEIKDEP